MTDDDEKPSTSSAPRGTGHRGVQGARAASAHATPLVNRFLTPLLVGAVVVLAVTAWWMKRPVVTSTTLPTVSSSIPIAAPLALDTGSRLVIVSPEFMAELDGAGRGRILGAEANGERLPVGETGIMTAGAWRPLALDEATRERLLADLGQIRSAWAARTAGEEASDTVATSTATSGDRPSLVIEEVKADRTTRLIFQLTTSSPEFAAAAEALTPLRLAR